MGGSTAPTQTVQTQTSGVNNPELNATISKLATGISNEYSPGKSLYQAPGANTVASQNAALSAASNPLYSSAVNGALSSFGNVAAGNAYGTNDPGFAALRSKVANDTLTGINSSFNNSGLFGSDSNMRAAGEGLGNALAGLDYSNFQNDQQRQLQAAGLLPSLFSAGQLPSSVQSQVGAAQDAASSAQANGATDYLAKLAGIINGTAGAAGTSSTSTNTQPGTPLWQIGLGGALGLASFL